MRKTIGRVRAGTLVVVVTTALLPAMATAADIATNVAPLSVGLSKRVLWQGAPPSSDDVDELERRIHLLVMGQPDAREGPRAWIERRDPEWQGSIGEQWPEWIDEEDASW